MTPCDGDSSANGTPEEGNPFLQIGNGKVVAELPLNRRVCACVYVCSRACVHSVCLVFKELLPLNSCVILSYLSVLQNKTETNFTRSPWRLNEITYRC